MPTSVYVGKTNELYLLKNVDLIYLVQACAHVCSTPDWRKTESDTYRKEIKSLKMYYYQRDTFWHLDWQK